MSLNETARDAVLKGLPQQHREALLNWASRHRIHDNDPAWALVDQGALIHEWQLESVRELEAAQRAATARIHRTSLAATRALGQAAQVARREVAEGLGDEVRELLAYETRRALAQASRGGWGHKVAHWVGPAVLGLVVAIGATLWVSHSQPSHEDQNLAQALKNAWPRLPASAKKIIAEGMK